MPPQAIAPKPPYKRSPCPKSERVAPPAFLNDSYAASVKAANEGETEDAGILRQKCGGGYRIVRKRIS